MIFPLMNETKKVKTIPDLQSCINYTNEIIKHRMMPSPTPWEQNQEQAQVHNLIIEMKSIKLHN